MEQTRYKRRLKRRKRKELKELNLLNRFLFNEVLEDPVAYRAVLEIILGHNIRLKANVQSEKEIRTLPTFRGIRLDVWGQDEEDNIYNSEMQRKNTRNLPRRSRYYQSVLDAGLLESYLANKQKEWDNAVASPNRHDYELRNYFLYV